MVVDSGVPAYGVFWAPLDGNPVDKITNARFDQVIAVEILNLEQWRQACKTQGLLNGSAADTPEQFAQHLVLIINNVPLEVGLETIKKWPVGKWPPGVWEWPYHRPLNDDEINNKDGAYGRAFGDCVYHILEFRLERNAQNWRSWARVLRSVKGWNPRVTVSVGFRRADGNYVEMPTWVRPPTGPAPGEDLPQYNFDLDILPKWFLPVFVLSAILTVVVLALLLNSPGLLREPRAEPRPDGLQPFSLSRCQMAFWMFLIVAAFLYLWAILDRVDTINQTATILLGISSVTAVSAALIPQSSTVKNPNTPSLDPEDMKLISEPFWMHWKTRFQRVSGQLLELETKQSKNTEPDPVLKTRIDGLAPARDYLKTPSMVRFLKDILSEDLNQLSFSRYQMLLWTLILGFVFVMQVWNKMEMPDFDVSLLTLLGISSGTYLGFKLPPATTK